MEDAIRKPSTPAPLVGEDTMAVARSAALEIGEARKNGEDICDVSHIVGALRKAAIDQTKA